MIENIHAKERFSVVIYRHQNKFFEIADLFFF
jgi:hypothetical protein